MNPYKPLTNVAPYDRAHRAVVHSDRMMHDMHVFGFDGRKPSGKKLYLLGRPLGPWVLSDGATNNSGKNEQGVTNLRRNLRVHAKLAIKSDKPAVEKAGADIMAMCRRGADGEPAVIMDTQELHSAVKVLMKDQHDYEYGHPETFDDRQLVPLEKPTSLERF